VLLIGTYSCAEGSSAIEAEDEQSTASISPPPEFLVEGPRVR